MKDLADSPFLTTKSPGAVDSEETSLLSLSWVSFCLSSVIKSVKLISLVPAHVHQNTEPCVNNIHTSIHSVHKCITRCLRPTEQLLAKSLGSQIT